MEWPVKTATMGETDTVDGFMTGRELKVFGADTDQGENACLPTLPVQHHWVTLPSYSSQRQESETGSDMIYWNHVKGKFGEIKAGEPFDREYGMREVRTIVPETKTLMFIGQEIS